MSKIAGIILAGGESKRFGAPKAAALLKGRPLIAHVRDRLAPQVQALAVAGDAYGTELPALSDGAHAGKGPLAGLYAGLEWAVSEDAGWLLTAPCDVPLLPLNLADVLLHVSDDDVPRAAEVEGRLQVACALWPVSARAPIEKQLTTDTYSLHRAFEAANGAGVSSKSFDGSFANINTADDLARLEAMLL